MAVCLASSWSTFFFNTDSHSLHRFSPLFFCCHDPSSCTCWVKAKTLPKEMEDALTAAHSKQRSNAEDPAVRGLEKTLNTMSLRMHEAQQQGTSIGNTGIIDLLANLDITPRETAAETSLRAAGRSASIEDQGGRHRGAVVGSGGKRGSEPEGLGVGGGRLFGQPGRGG